MSEWIQRTIEDREGNKIKLNFINNPNDHYLNPENIALGPFSARFDIFDLNDIPEDTETFEEKKERIEREAGFKTIKNIPKDQAQYYIRNKKCPECNSKMYIYSRESWAYHWYCVGCKRIYMSCIPDTMGTNDSRDSLSEIKFI